MSPASVISPFKLLQPYDKGDVRIFFGRENETRQLAEALMRSKFLLLYGASGTGKTSLIQCGLHGMFSPRDWLPIFVRRGDDFLESLRDAVLEQYQARFHMRYPGRKPVLDEKISLRDAIKALFSIAYVPVYLILDQFEEIFTLGSQEEQTKFFEALAELRLFEEDMFCKLIITTREEYIAHFYQYEKALPFLFEYRFRVEKMRQEQLLAAVQGTLAASYAGSPSIVADEAAAAQILYNLTDERGEVDLTTLQVYLDRLYREDVERKTAANRQHILFDAELVGQHKLQNVLSDFLDQQVAVVAQGLPKSHGEGFPLQVLFKLVTSQGTKQHRSALDIWQELNLSRRDIDQKTVRQCLERFAAPDVRILNKVRFAKTAEERFEIMHDRLAEQVFAKFNAEEISQREAKATLEVKQKRHTQTGEYLSPGELELVGKSLQVDRLEAALKEFYENSESYHNSQERRRRWVTFGAVVAAVVFGIISVLAYTASKEAKRQEENALAALKQVELEKEETQKERDRAEKNNLLAQENERIAKQERANAELALEQVKKEKTATEEQRKRAEENLIIANQKAVEAERERQNAEDALRELLVKSTLEVQGLIKEAKVNIYHLRYSQALNNLGDAYSIGVEKDSVARYLLEIAFFYSETGHADTARIALGLAAGLMGQLGSASLAEMLKLPGFSGLDSALRYRYFPTMILVEGGDAEIGFQRIPAKVSTFKMAETETTMWQYALFCYAKGLTIGNFHFKPWGEMRGDDPVILVSWYDAALYANWLSEQSSLKTTYDIATNGADDQYGWNVTIDATAEGYRLPSEVEWEYAARGGKNWVRFEYSGSGTTVGPFHYDIGSRTNIVKSLRPNGLGLYDMSVNVWEWCEDWHGGYPNPIELGYRGPEDGSGRVVRGGCDGRCAGPSRVNNSNYPANRRNFIGFRVVFIQ
jgi:formylglycine-generating enzyme required for sulfatase activity